MAPPLCIRVLQTGQSLKRPPLRLDLQMRIRGMGFIRRVACHRFPHVGRYLGIGQGRDERMTQGMKRKQSELATLAALLLPLWRNDLGLRHETAECVA
jgi:hypothetical protein